MLTYEGTFHYFKPHIQKPLDRLIVALLRNGYNRGLRAADWENNSGVDNNENRETVMSDDHGGVSFPATILDKMFGMKATSKFIVSSDHFVNRDILQVRGLVYKMYVGIMYVQGERRVATMSE